MKTVMLAAAAVVAVVLSAGEAVTLYSWENDAEKWEGFSGFSATGATAGEHAAVRAVPAGWNNALQSNYSPELRAKLTGPKFLAVDVTPAGTIPPGAKLSVTAQIIFEGGPDTGLELGAQPVKAGTQTLVWDYSAFAERIAAATGWAHVRFITEAYGYPDGAAPGDVYLDNLRASVEKPEPAKGGAGAAAP